MTFQLRKRPKKPSTEESYYSDEFNCWVSIKYKPVKNVYLRILPNDGAVHISAPLHLSSADIQTFLLLRKAWVQNKLKALKQKVIIGSMETALQEQSLLYRGQRLTLNIITTDIQRSEPSIEVDFDNRVLHFYTPTVCTPSQLGLSLTRFLKAQLESRIQESLPVWLEKTQQQVSDVRIKRMKTRWGSCNVRARRIWINFELIKLPDACLDYIILHEIVHLYERYHNKRFYAYMDEFMPDWQRIDQELNRFILP